jgi:hypothetical protein
MLVGIQITSTDAEDEKPVIGTSHPTQFNHSMRRNAFYVGPYYNKGRTLPMRGGFTGAATP